ncbi:DUF916 domain-containing protein [Streptomyces sp. NBC_00291]|uniref:WxL protein peptidoglycan domain-containing protein n=1 Tax=Streptomyces sp. NBC_00291 TaxID=2975704 RepID=UPI0022553E5D|nr:DUF916 domain-containing protein [Streptomyces sp. NBC_00291]MCX5153053.1 DUF916 domain-containing protein [Streptomyces sp. NBC_00291]
MRTRTSPSGTPHGPRPGRRPDPLLDPLHGLRLDLRLRLRLGLLLGLLLPVAGLLPAVSASAADNGTWGVFPTPAAGAAMTDRAYFFHQGAAGSTVRDSVTIVNSSDRELTFQVFATDAVNTPVGGAFALLPVESKPKDVGTWTALSTGAAGTVTVAPKGREDIPFTVKVPEDATPGDHVGGIVALNTAVEGVRADGKVQVGVKRSVGARLYFRVPGPLTPGLSVEDVRVSRGAPLLPWFKDARATVSYALVNRGNVVVEPKVRISAEGLFGRDVLDRPGREPRLVLLPGQRIELTEPWADSPQLDWVTVRVAAGASAYPDLASESETDFLAVPWLAAGIALLLTVAGIAFAILRRRRNMGPQQVEDVPHLAPTP